MRVMKFSDARNQFKQVIDQVVADCDVTIISRRDADAVSYTHLTLPTKRIV